MTQILGLVLLFLGRGRQRKRKWKEDRAEARDLQELQVTRDLVAGQQSSAVVNLPKLGCFGEVCCGPQEALPYQDYGMLAVLWKKAERLHGHMQSFNRDIWFFQIGSSPPISKMQETESVTICSQTRAKG